MQRRTSYDGDALARANGGLLRCLAVIAYADAGEEGLPCYGCSGTE